MANRVTVMVPPELGLALETRKLELKKSGIPVKTMADLIARMLDETSGITQQVQSNEHVKTIYPASQYPESHRESHRLLEDYLLSGKGNAATFSKMMEVLMEAGAKSAGKRRSGSGAP